VVVVGGVDRVEVWPKKAHEKFDADVKAKAEEMREMAINAAVSSQLI
jgi:DNA-binding transcriptional regulator/RsmH inhibitor MraZ